MLTRSNSRRSSGSRLNLRLRWSGGHLQRETRQGHILLCMALWSVISFLLISNFLFCSVTVSGRSMEPTLFEGEQHILNRWAYRFFPINHGDLVVLRDRPDGVLVVKRVIALPHDVIQLRHDGVYLNGARLQEDYIAPKAYTYSLKMGDRPLTLGDDEYFVMGDNRLVSLDSRYHGPFRSADLLGTLPR